MKRGRGYEEAVVSLEDDLALHEYARTRYMGM